MEPMEDLGNPCFDGGVFSGSPFMGVESSGKLGGRPVGRGSVLGRVLPYAESIGALVGIGLGWSRRISEHMLPGFKSAEMCVMPLESSLMNDINVNMQGYIKGPLKYIFPVVSLSLLALSPVVKGCWAKWHDQAGAKSLRRHIADAAGTVPWGKVVMAAGLIGLACVTGMNRRATIGQLPFILSAVPSGHTMMQTTLGLVSGLMTRGFWETGWKPVAVAVGLVACGLGVANMVFLSQTAYVCHTVLEITEGVEWTATLLTGTFLATKMMGALGSLFMRAPPHAHVE